MPAERVNRISGRVSIALSLIALLTVISGYFQRPQADEGTAAHIFQFSVLLDGAAILAFLATADWSRPGRSLRPLGVSVVALVLAFGALYYLEHFR